MSRARTCLRHGARVTAHGLTAAFVGHTAFVVGEPVFHTAAEHLSSVVVGPIALPVIVGLHAAAKRLEA